MFMVCVLHVIGLSRSMQQVPQEGWDYALGVYGAQSVCLTAVNLYALVTGYVCVMGEARLSRYLRLWMQAAFYTVGIYFCWELAGYLFNADWEPMAIRRWLKAIIPVPFASVYWYFTAYTALYLLIPFVNPLLRSASRACLGGFLLLLLVVLVPASIIQQWPIFSQGYNAAWLLLLYAVGAYARLYPNSMPRGVLLAGAALGALMTMGCMAMLGWVLGNFLFPGVVLSSVCLFLFFLKLEIRGRAAARLIGVLAPLSFGVYLVHVHPCFWRLQINHLPRLFEHFHYSWWLFPAVPIAIYLACTLVDALRAGLFRLLHANALADALARGLTRLWNILLPLLQKGLDAWGGREETR